MVDIISSKSKILWQIVNLEKDHMFQTKEAENNPDHEIRMVRGEKSVPTQNNYNTAGTIVTEQHTFPIAPFGAVCYCGKL